jgi:hypothetical protein
MRRGGAVSQRLLLLLAILSTLVLLGCWDNRRQLQRVLDQGYETMAQITGGQFQRSAPFALDGWRPRFVEQDLSVDLKWQGKDGKERTHHKVPVTEGFARNIVSGEQVRLATLPIKAMDDPQAVPVIRPDASARLASLQSWTTNSTIVALSAWAGVFALGFLFRRPEGAAAPRIADLPPRRTLFGVLTLLGGAFITYQAESVTAPVSAGGIETTAEIVAATTMPAVGGSGTHRVVQLSWKDGQGAVRRFGPVPISEDYWQKITRDGQLVERRATIRYLEDNQQARPMIVEDQPAPTWRSRFASAAGILLMIVGAGCLISAARHLRDASTNRS